MVLDPSLTIMIIWELIVNIVYVFSFFTFPFVMISPGTMLPTIWWLEFIFDIFIFGDLIMDFFTAYHDGDELVTDHKMIIINYLSTYFIFDLLSSAPGLFTLEWRPELYFMKCFRYVQFKRFLEFLMTLLNEVTLILSNLISK